MAPSWLAVCEAIAFMVASKLSDASSSPIAARRSSRWSGGRMASTLSCSAICSRSWRSSTQGSLARRNGGVRLASERLGDHSGGFALAREDPTVDDGDTGGVPGVGWLTGPGLAGIATVGVQG